MSVADEARAEAERCWPTMDDPEMERRAERLRIGFIVGAEWQASRKVEVTDEYRRALIELAAHASIDAKYPNIGWRHISGDAREFWLRQGSAAVDAILAALGGHTKGEN